MLRNLLFLLCLFALLALVALKIRGGEESRFAGSFRVIDGDSLALGETRLRLLGIDAPEIKQVCRRDGAGWNCGIAARRKLTEFAAAIGFQCSGSRFDKYRRRLVTCLVGGTDVNQAMVRAGMAVAFGRYEKDEAAARLAHAGVWAGEFNRPVDWRRAHRAGLGGEEPHVPAFLGRLFGWDG